MYLFFFKRSHTSPDNIATLNQSEFVYRNEWLTVFMKTIANTNKHPSSLTVLLCPFMFPSTRYNQSLTQSFKSVNPK